MSVWILLPPRGFPGRALLSVVERLREHGVAYQFASARAGRCEGTGGVHATAERGIDALEPGEAEALIVLDDRRGSLANSDEALRLLRKVAAAGRVVAGIGRGVLVLGMADLLRGKAVAAEPELAHALAERGAEPLVSEPTSVAGNILCATEAGAAGLADGLDSFRGVEGSPIVPV